MINALSICETEVVSRLARNLVAPPLMREYLTFLHGVACWRKKVGPSGVFAHSCDPQVGENQRSLGKIAATLKERGLVNFAQDTPTLQTVILTDLGENAYRSFNNPLPSETRKELT